MTSAASQAWDDHARVASVVVNTVIVARVWASVLTQAAKSGTATAIPHQLLLQQRSNPRHPPLRAHLLLLPRSPSVQERISVVSLVLGGYVQVDSVAVGMGTVELAWTSAPIQTVKSDTVTAILPQHHRQTLPHPRHHLQPPAHWHSNPKHHRHLYLCRQQ